MGQKIRSHKLSPHIKKIMKEIHSIIGEGRFILYGSTPIDLLLNKNTEIHDLDIAIEGVNKYRIKKCREKIKKQGFEIIEPFRKYYIHKNKEAILIYAKNNKYFLDIAFLDDFGLIGHFNIETLFFRYPQMEYVDKFEALRSIKEKKIKLIRDLEEENPHLLLGRFLRLCSKYNISLKEPTHLKILLNLKTKIQQWKMTSNFHREAYISCISSLLKSITQSYDKSLFVKTIIDTSILTTIFPELEHVVKIHRDKIIKEISNIRKKRDIVILLNRYLKPQEQKVFKKKIKALKKRQWDIQDIQCANCFK